MPYKSLSQERKFHAMESRGQISHATVAEWDRESKGKHLPEHVKASRHLANKKRKASDLLGK